MDIIVNDKATNWYINELDLQKGDKVKFFVRYGGCSNVQKGFSLGVAKQIPEDVGSSVDSQGITFFVEDRDLWYFDNHNLHVDLDEEIDEPVFSYEEPIEQ